MPIGFGLVAFIPIAPGLNMLGVGSAFTEIVRLVKVMAHVDEDQ